MAAHYIISKLHYASFAALFMKSKIYCTYCVVLYMISKSHCTSSAVLYMIFKTHVQVVLRFPKEKKMLTSVIWQPAQHNFQLCDYPKILSKAVPSCSIFLLVIFQEIQCT